MLRAELPRRTRVDEPPEGHLLVQKQVLGLVVFGVVERVHERWILEEYGPVSRPGNVVVRAPSRGVRPPSALGRGDEG